MRLNTLPQLIAGKRNILRIGLYIRAKQYIAAIRLDIQLPIPRGFRQSVFLRQRTHRIRRQRLCAAGLQPYLYRSVCLFYIDLDSFSDLNGCLLYTSRCV